MTGGHTRASDPATGVHAAAARRGREHDCGVVQSLPSGASATMPCSLEERAFVSGRRVERVLGVVARAGGAVHGSSADSPRAWRAAKCAATGHRSMEFCTSGDELGVSVV